MTLNIIEESIVIVFEYTSNELININEAPVNFLDLQKIGSKLYHLKNGQSQGWIQLVTELNNTDAKIIFANGFEVGALFDRVYIKYTPISDSELKNNGWTIPDIKEVAKNIIGTAKFKRLPKAIGNNFIAESNTNNASQKLIGLCNLSSEATKDIWSCETSLILNRMSKDDFTKITFSKNIDDNQNDKIIVQSNSHFRIDNGLSPTNINHRTNLHNDFKNYFLSITTSMI